MKNPYLEIEAGQAFRMAGTNRAEFRARAAGVQKPQFAEFADRRLRALPHRGAENAGGGARGWLSRAVGTVLWIGAALVIIVIEPEARTTVVTVAVVIGSKDRTAVMMVIVVEPGE